MLSDLWDEIKQNIKDKIKYFWSKFKYILLLILVIAIAFMILILNRKTPDQVESQEIYVFEVSLSNLSEWITIITIPITAIWAIFQYKKNIRLKQQEKASEIAKMFSDRLLRKCSILWAVVEISELKNLLNLREINMNNLKRFDMEEISSLYANDNDFWEKYKMIRDSSRIQSMYLYILESRISQKKFKEIYLRKREDIEKEIVSIMSSKYTENEIETLKNKKTLDDEFKRFVLANGWTEKQVKDFYRKEYTDDEAYELLKFDNIGFPVKFTSLIDDVLNELEYVCMCISSNSAGSKFVYQSLHQVFLKTIKSLAVEIASRNKNCTDKYYVNIIHVYKEWSKIRVKSQIRESKNKEKAYKYLEPRIEKI